MTLTPGAAVVFKLGTKVIRGFVVSIGTNGTVLVRSGELEKPVRLSVAMFA